MNKVVSMIVENDVNKAVSEALLSKNETNGIIVSAKIVNANCNDVVTRRIEELSIKLTQSGRKLCVLVTTIEESQDDLLTWRPTQSASAQLICSNINHVGAEKLLTTLRALSEGEFFNTELKKKRGEITLGQTHSMAS